MSSTSMYKNIHSQTKNRQTNKQTKTDAVNILFCFNICISVRFHLSGVLLFRFCIYLSNMLEVKSSLNPSTISSVLHHPKSTSNLQHNEFERQRVEKTYFHIKIKSVT